MYFGMRIGNAIPWALPEPDFDVASKGGSYAGGLRCNIRGDPRKLIPSVDGFL